MNIRCRESVCRNLFGPVDHDQLRQDLQLKLKEMMSQDSQRWNFNFQSETPQLGRFQWEEILAGRAASFYQESPQPVVEVNSPRTEDGGSENNNDEHLGTNQENYLSVSNTLKHPAERMPTRTKRSLSKPVAKSNDARITDYFAKRRRSTEAKSIVSLFHTNFNKETQCGTIR
ncbi:cyclin-dependent kinase inhibitor 1Ca [Gambusia affinis]|uniref:cyclin-dependent kinase inhibitor 1Ca n=1 Tax=Gambusia affinis TaxID=33528 RepID=UPI001CDD47CE|nr:cyclin-dependent kinase inhibitor 1Ca [Gambusia affinis]